MEPVEDYPRTEETSESASDRRKPAETIFSGCDGRKGSVVRAAEKRKHGGCALHSGSAQAVDTKLR